MSEARDVAGLVKHWRTVGATLRRYGAEEQASAIEQCADELERSSQKHDDAPLTLQEAAKFGGYSAEHLGRLVREGKVPNAGRKGAPRIARKDVPIKAGKVASGPQIREIEFKQIVRSAIKEGAA